MRKYLFWLVCAAAALVIVGGVVIGRPDQRPSAERKPKTSVAKESSEPEDSFEFRLFSSLVKQEPTKNVFVSPTSVFSALAMTYNGAAGETQKAMAKALGIGSTTLDDFNQRNARLLASLKSPDAGVTLKIANSLWVGQGVEFKPEFAHRCRSFYEARAASVNFGDPSAASTINSWVKQRTEGRIDELLDRTDPETILVLVNAVYFKGGWEKPFKKADTKELPFTLADGGKATVPMMSQTDEFRYYKGRDFQGIRLPYEGARMSIYVFLPNESSSLKAFLSQLNAADWRSWMSRFDSQKVTLTLPKFKLEYKAEKQMKTALTKMGMGIAFDPGAADFSAMRTSPTWIDKVIHKSVIEVDERGTVAAAATAVVMWLEAAPPPSPAPSMIVDRPFFCAISDDKTGEILFMGAVVDPRQN